MVEIERWSSALMDWLTRIGDGGARALDGAAQAMAHMAGGTLRLGVTGLRRSGKTVFITSTLNNLLLAGRLPFLDVLAQGRFIGAQLRPQPDGAIPRFDYESHLSALTGPIPEWPKATRAVSEIRIALRFRPGGLVRRRLGGVATLNLDIIDYPGEWLLDLPMLRQDFSDWSAMTLELVGTPSRYDLARPWLEALDTVDPGAAADESIARRLAALYTQFLLECRASRVGLSLLQPGRFLEPGEMAGAPILTFCPLPGPEGGRWRTGSLGALMQERFEGYKDKVIRRFFRDHFARIDRQIVLVDLLSAINAGEPGMEDLRRSLSATLESFRHGRGGWLDWLGGARVDRVLFAATKADHVAAPQHAALTGLLEALMADRLRHMRFEGAAVKSLSLASVKCTDNVLTAHEGRELACIQGIPLGRTEPVVLFPGELPDSHLGIGAAVTDRFRFTDFQPPPELGRDGRGLPNIRLDQTLEFLIGDRLT